MTGWASDDSKHNAGYGGYRYLNRKSKSSPALRLRRVGLLDQAADAPIEARHHAIGLCMTWWRQAMYYAHLGTTHIEHMLARGALILAGKAIRELTLVVC